MKYQIGLIILLSIFLIHCNPPNSKTGFTGIVIKENPNIIQLSPIKEKSVFIENINYPSIYLDNNEVIVHGFSLKPKNNYILYAYDKDLNLIKEKLFNTGQGPGDLGGAPNIFSVDDQIYIPDNTQRRINIFDKNFNFIKFLKINSEISSPIFSRDGKYFISCSWSAGKYGPNSYFTVYLTTFPDLKRRLLHNFPEFNSVIENKKEAFLGVGGIHYFIKNDKIYLLDKDNYVLTIRNAEGKTEKEIRVDIKKVSISGKMAETWLQEHYGANKYLPKNRIKIRLPEYVQPCAWMIPLEKGFVVIRKYGYSVYCQGLVEADYFNYNLDLLGKVKFPCFNEIFWLRNHVFLKSCEVKNGFLFLVNSIEKDNDEIITLEKWKITE